MRITRATIKGFVNRNRENLLFRGISDFDPMTDCVEHNSVRVWAKAHRNDCAEDNRETSGIAGVWLVGGSRNCFSSISEPGITGYHCYNCCGSWDIGVEV
jgi:hypothetical protein